MNNLKQKKKSFFVHMSNKGHMNFHHWIHWLSFPLSPLYLHFKFESNDHQCKVIHSHTFCPVRQKHDVKFGFAHNNILIDKAMCGNTRNGRVYVCLVRSELDRRLLLSEARITVDFYQNRFINIIISIMKCIQWKWVSGRQAVIV